MLVVRPIVECIKHASRNPPPSDHETIRTDRGQTMFDEDDESSVSFNSIDSSEPGRPAREDAHETGHAEGSGDIVVHCFIETIEFVLGSISNTASYLRLWALSLAHRQLSMVFFDMTVGGKLRESTNGLLSAVGVVFGFFQLFVATAGVIMCMDVMECFLHALRLHWYPPLTQGRIPKQVFQRRRQALFPIFIPLNF